MNKHATPAFCNERLQRMIQAAFFMCLLIIVWLALSPKPPSASALLWDKTNHFLAFFVLQILATLSWPNRVYVRSGLYLLGFGCAIELIQAALPHRSSSFLDLIADSIGIISAQSFIALMQILLRKIIIAQNNSAN